VAAADAVGFEMPGWGTSKEMRKMRKSGIWIMAACLIAVTASPVLASGFSIYEQSGKASAQAGAWVARSDDAAANWYNPAALVHLEGKQVQFGMNMITVGSDTELSSSDIEWGLPMEMTFETDGEVATPLHFYYSHKVNDRFAWGVGLNNPFGLVSAWTDIPVTLSHQRAELHTFLLNPNIAFAINDHWSFGFGWTYILADIKEFSRVIDQSALLGLDPLSVLGETDLSGDGDDWGWDAALHYKADNWSFGFTYRSALDPLIEGNVVFSDINPALGPGGADLFPNGPGTAVLNLPAQAAIGVAFMPNDKWEVEFDITWAGWSDFEALEIDFENETFIEPFPDVFVPVVEDIYLREDWSNTKAFRLGAAYKLSDRHALYFGALTDEAPVPVDTLRPSIPDSDRDSVTIGYGFSGAKWDFDFYYMPLWFDKITADGAQEEGVIDGTYSSFTHLAGVTVNYRF
jgi:long-chain fatty acid transport protein